MTEHQNSMEAARIGGAAVGMTIYGLTLNEWVALATIVYMVCQIIILAPKAYAIVRGWVKCVK